jgi:hypothetical protein
MRFVSTTARLALLILIAMTVSAFADTAGFKRRALVVANATYQNTGVLKNPINDAALIAGKLKELGFEVELEQDLDARRFSEVLDDFSTRLDKDTEALIYYAGHGLQYLGENFLVGIDARLKSQATLQFETFKLNQIIGLIESRAYTLLLFWDACRDNPLAEGLLRSAPMALSAEPSLMARGGAAAVPQRAGDTLIVFSAASGKKALDGEGELSPFADALGRHITGPDEINVMLNAVTAQVLERTRGFQWPERQSNLTRNFYFRAGGLADRTYEEIRNLKTQLAALQREAAPARKRLTIIGTDDVEALRKAMPAAPTATAPPAGRARGAGDAETPARGPVAEQAKPELAKGPEPADHNVMVAVDRAASAIVRRLRISPDGKLLAVGDEEGLVRVVQLDRFEVIATIRAHRGRISDLDFSPDSRILLSAGRDGMLRFWDIDNIRAAPVRELKAPAAIPYSARINPALPDRFVLMGDREGRVVAWNLKHNQIITNTKFHQGPVHSVAYRPGGGGTYLSGGADGELRIRLPEGQRLSLHAHNGVMFQASYSATGRLVYTVGADRTAKIWDAARTGQLQATMSGHLKYVLAADMSPDEKMLVTGGGDKALNLWDVASGRLIGRMQGHTSDIEAVAFSPNGKFIVSSSEDKSVMIWSADNREELARLFFQKNGEKYAGVTFQNQIFGDRDSGLLSVYLDGRQLSGADAERTVRYIGRGIAIIEADF